MYSQHVLVSRVTYSARAVSRLRLELPLSTSPSKLSSSFICRSFSSLMATPMLFRPSRPRLMFSRMSSCSLVSSLALAMSCSALRRGASAPPPAAPLLPPSRASLSVADATTVFSSVRSRARSAVARRTMSLRRCTSFCDSGAEPSARVALAATLLRSFSAEVREDRRRGTRSPVGAPLARSASRSLHREEICVSERLSCSASASKALIMLGQTCCKHRPPVQACRLLPARSSPRYRGL